MLLLMPAGKGNQRAGLKIRLHAVFYCSQRLQKVSIFARLRTIKKGIALLNLTVLPGNALFYART